MPRLVALLILLICLVCPADAQTAQVIYEEGLQLKKDKNYQGAKAKFLTAIELKPGYPEALYELGWCENETREYNKAIRHLNELLVTWPDVPKVLFELGYAYEKANKTDSAVIIYNRCIIAKPDYLNAFKQLAGIAYTQDNYTLALEHYNKALSRINTEIKDYLFWYRKGFCENAAKDFSSAKISLQNSLKYKTDYTNTYLELGFACQQQKLNDEAIGYFKKAMELDPKSHIPYNGIGEVYRDNIRNREEAMLWYKKTLDINLKERKANFGMGYCLNSLGRWQEAVPYLKTAIESEPNYSAAFVELGYSHYKTDRLPEAIDYLNHAISLNNKNVNAHYYLALIYLKQNNKEKALQMAEALKNLGSPYAAEILKKAGEL